MMDSYEYIYVCSTRKRLTMNTNRTSDDKGYIRKFMSDIFSGTDME